MSLTEVLDPSGTTPTFASMIGIAGGIDHALLVVYRYRARPVSLDSARAQKVRTGLTTSARMRATA